ncbi:MAG: DUF3857 domain-containing protein [Chitinophagales bacterium]|nr:DUF3857 domain-containing protein [Chitinophagales bacterium]
MKIKIIFLLFILLIFKSNFSRSIQLTKNYEQVDDNIIKNNSAYVLLDNKHVEYKFEVGSTSSYFFKVNTLYKAYEVTTYHRKIRINNLNVINDFNKIYIPIFSKSTTEVENIKAVTIKPDGSTVELDVSDVKETTLPANIPYLRKYKGLVKLFVLPNVNVGDEIEYMFTVKTQINSRVNTNYFNVFDVNYFEAEYPTKEKNLTVTMSKKFTFKSFPINISEKFVETTQGTGNDAMSIYTLTLKNLPALLSEDYTIEANQIPGAIYQVIGKNVSDNGATATWDDELDDFFKKTKTSSIVTEDLTIKDIVKKIAAKNGFNNQMQELCSIINKSYYTNDGEYIDDAYNAAFSNQDYNIYNKIAEELNYTVNFWFVTNIKNGKLNKDFPSLEQFDDVVVEFVNPQTKETAFLPLFKPLDLLNYVNYDYNNEALKVYNTKEGTKYEFVDFKTKKVYPSNKIVFDYNVKFNTNSGYSTNYDVTTTYYGKYMEKYKTEFYKYKYNDKDNKLYRYMENSIYNMAENVQLTDLKLNPYDYEKDTDLSINKKFSIINNTATVPYYPLTLNKIMDSYSDIIINTENRKTDAYFGVPHAFEFNFKFDLDQGKFISNDIFNTNFSNEIGSLKSTVTNTSDKSITVNIVYKIDADKCSKSDWSKYSELNNKFESLFLISFLIASN